MSKGLYKSLEESGVAEEQVNKEITRLTVTEVCYALLIISCLIRHYETADFFVCLNDIAIVLVKYNQSLVINNH